MKKITLILVAVLFAVTGIFAQTPMQFKYQAILRDAGGTAITNEAEVVVIDILEGSAAGVSIFNETHNVTTTSQGLINLNVGSINDMSGIDWSANTYFIKITVGSTVMGTSQLLSVPYAMTAKTAETIDYTNVANTPAIPEDVSDLTDNTNLFFDRDYNSLSNLPTLFDGQWTSLTGTAPNISTFTNDEGYLTDFSELDPNFTSNFDLTNVANGDLLQYNGTKFEKFTPNYLTAEIDGSVSNEIQDLELTSNILKITNNTSATSINLSPYLDDQTVSITAGTGISVTGTYPNFTVSNTNVAMHYVGELYGGGIVFWVNHTGEHGLIINMLDLAVSQSWSNVSTSEIGTTSTWDGASNATDIMGQSGHTSSAAKVCADYTNADYGTGTYSDWYLPSIYELNDLWSNIKTVTKAFDSDGNSSTIALNQDYYWSSTEGSSDKAWLFYFYSGHSYSFSKSYNYYVRAVRAF